MCLVNESNFGEHKDLFGKGQRAQKEIEFFLKQFFFNNSLETQIQKVGSIEYNDGYGRSKEGKVFTRRKSIIQYLYFLFDIKRNT